MPAPTGRHKEALGDNAAIDARGHRFSAFAALPARCGALPLLAHVRAPWSLCWSGVLAYCCTGRGVQMMKPR